MGSLNAFNKLIYYLFVKVSYFYYICKMEKIKLQCNSCGKNVYRTLRDISKSNSKGYKNVYCSNTCQGAHRKKIKRKEILDRGTQVCVFCKEDKNLKEFNKNKSRTSGYNTICRTCSNENSKKYYNDNKELHKKRTSKRNKEEGIKVRERVLEYLMTHFCITCGQKDVRTLQFDHRDSKTKIDNVGSLIGKMRSWKVIKEEIDKCDVLCANCHSIKTAKDFNWYKNIY